MKKLALILCFIIFASPKTYSQLFEENFDYPLFTLINTTPAWTPVFLSGLLPIAVTIPGGLVFPTYAGSAMGNAVTLFPDLPVVLSEDDYASLSSAQSSGSIYSSFMLNIIAAQPGGDYFFALRTPLGAADCRVYARKDGVFGFNLGIEKANGSGAVYAPGTYNILTTYLVVVQYTFVPGAGNDEMSLYVFDASSPPPFIQPTPTLGPIPFGAGTDPGSLSTVLLRQGGETTAATMIIDGIIIDNLWNNNVLPVELASFTSDINRRDVTLSWTTSSENDNSRFDIERSVKNGESQSSWSNIGNVAGNGTTVSANNYSFKDRGLATGNYSYRLKQIDFNGNFKYYNLGNEVSVGIPANFDLSQNYPNPFNPTTRINFDLPVSGNVNIKLYDISGKEVAVLLNESRSAGYHTVDFKATGLSSGAYFYTLSAGNFTSTKKMMLTK